MPQDPFITLRDAGAYITKLPKTEHEAAEWQAAMEALILVATSGGPTMFARIGVMQALNRRVERCSTPHASRIIGESGSLKGINEICFLALASVSISRVRAEGLQSMSN